jgi:hypothetical protein
MLDMAARRSEGGVNIKTKTKINNAREEPIKKFTSSIVRYGPRAYAKEPYPV